MFVVNLIRLVRISGVSRRAAGECVERSVSRARLEVGERMSAPLAAGADGNGVNGLSNPPTTLTRTDLSLFRSNLNTIRRWAAGGTACNR